MKTLFAIPALLSLLALPVGHDATSALPAPAGDYDWAVDPGHSSVMFKVRHANAANFYGNFETVTGTLSLDPAAPATGSVKLTIPVDSIHTRDQKRDGHLKGPDFFNGKENPDITFESTKVAAKGDGVYEITGDLELAGEVQSVTATARKTGEGEFYGPRIGYETRFTIQRSKFGMDYGIAQNVLGDDITVLISLELVKPK